MGKELTAEILNNKIIKLRKLVGIAKRNVYQKLERRLNAFTDKSKKKRCEYLAGELQVLKEDDLDVDEVVKFALLNTKDICNLCSQKGSTPKDKALFKVACAKPMVEAIDAIRNEYQNWGKEIPFILQRLGNKKSDKESELSNTLAGLGKKKVMQDDGPKPKKGRFEAEEESEESEDIEEEDESEEEMDVESEEKQPKVPVQKVKKPASSDDELPISQRVAKIEKKKLIPIHDAEVSNTLAGLEKKKITQNDVLKPKTGRFESEKEENEDIEEEDEFEEELDEESEEEQPKIPVARKTVQKIKEPASSDDELPISHLVAKAEKKKLIPIDDDEVSNTLAGLGKKKMTKNDVPKPKKGRFEPEEESEEDEDIEGEDEFEEEMDEESEEEQPKVPVSQKTVQKVKEPASSDDEFPISQHVAKAKKLIPSDNDGGRRRGRGGFDGVRGRGRGGFDGGRGGFDGSRGRGRGGFDGGRGRGRGGFDGVRGRGRGGFDGGRGGFDGGRGGFDGSRGRGRGGFDGGRGRGRGGFDGGRGRGRGGFDGGRGRGHGGFGGGRGGFDGSRGRSLGGFDGGRGRGRGGQNHNGENRDRGSERRSHSGGRSDVHPSWAAKQQQRSASNTPRGKKVVFDD